MIEHQPGWGRGEFALDFVVDAAAAPRRRRLMPSDLQR